MSNGLRAAVAVALVAVVVALFFVFEDDAGEEGVGGGASTTQSEPAPSAGGLGSQNGAPVQPEPVATIVVRDGEPVGGVKELQFDAGDQISFRVESDESGDLHVHGYELETPVGAGGSTDIAFEATLEGAYEVELHSHAGGEIPIAEIRVNP